jgi:hypothetical protein
VEFLLLAPLTLLGEEALGTMNASSQSRKRWESRSSAFVQPKIAMSCNIHRAATISV